MALVSTLSGSIVSLLRHEVNAEMKYPAFYGAQKINLTSHALFSEFDAFYAQEG
jgi:hypothetical protein